jgi:hypothetical protein
VFVNTALRVEDIEEVEETTEDDDRLYPGGKCNILLKGDRDYTCSASFKDVLIELVTLEDTNISATLALTND